MKAPTFSELIEAEKYENTEKIEKIVTIASDKTNNDVENSVDMSKEEKHRNIETSNMLYRLSMKIKILSDNDLLRVVYLLSHKKIPLEQLRLSYTSENDKNIDKKYEKIIKNEKYEKIGNKNDENENNILTVLDSRLHGMLSDLSPGKMKIEMCL